MIESATPPENRKRNPLQTFSSTPVYPNFSNPSSPERISEKNDFLRVAIFSPDLPRVRPYLSGCPQITSSGLTSKTGASGVYVIPTPLGNPWKKDRPPHLRTIHSGTHPDNRFHKKPVNTNDPRQTGQQSVHPIAPIKASLKPTSPLPTRSVESPCRKRTYP